MWKFDETEIDNSKLASSMDELINHVHTGSVSLSVNKVISFTAYLAFSGNEIWLTSKATTEHVTALGDTLQHAAVCIWQQPDEWGDPLFGLQLSGMMELAKENEVALRGLHALHERFPGTRGTLPDVSHVFGDERVTCLQRVIVSEGKIRDERRLGGGMHKISWEGSRS